MYKLESNGLYTLFGKGAPCTTMYTNDSTMPDHINANSYAGRLVYLQQTYSNPMITLLQCVSILHWQTHRHKRTNCSAHPSNLPRPEATSGLHVTAQQIPHNHCCCKLLQTPDRRLAFHSPAISQVPAQSFACWVPPCLQYRGNSEATQGSHSTHLQLQRSFIRTPPRHTEIPPPHNIQSRIYFPTHEESSHNL